MSIHWLKRTVPVLMALLAVLMFAHSALAQQVVEVQLVGAIEEMTTDSITVNGRLVDTSSAVIQTALEVGAVVRVEGTLGTSNIIVAREITGADLGLLPGEMEIVGTLESHAETTMTVAGQAFDVSTAEIGAGVTVGQMVKIHATLNAQEAWIVREVESFTVADPSLTPLPTGEFEIVGTLEQITTQSIVVAGQTIDVANAEINDPLIIGVLVKVHVSSLNGQLVAREVELAQRDTAVNAVIVGAITAINGNVITVNSFAVTIDASNPILATLQVAMVVQVEGTFQVDGSVLAVHVRVPEAGDDNANGNNNANDNTASGSPTITLQRASEIALAVYPNATIVRIELTTKFGGTLVWEVHLSNRIEMNIDANDGTILTIDRPGDDNNANANGNDNSDDNGNDNNANGNDNSNDNGDDNGNDNNDNGDDHGGGDNSNDNNNNDSGG